MNDKIRLKNLKVPSGRIDVVLDTDAYNEVDDQFAIAYLLGSSEKLNTLAFCAAPFFNANSTSPADGMEKSFNEIHKILQLAGAARLRKNVYRGSKTYLTDEKAPVVSEATTRIVSLAAEHTPDNPLYVVCIGAITNAASAILTAPDIMIDNTVIVWLGGNAHHMPDTYEFNMSQDFAAARVIFGCGVPLVQLPCAGVVDIFAAAQPELEYWLRGKNGLCDYLIDNVIRSAAEYADGKVWSRVIWDVTAVGWLLNDKSRFMHSSLVATPIPEYDGHYAFDCRRHLMRYVYSINRDALFGDLFTKLANKF